MKPSLAFTAGAVLSCIMACKQTTQSVKTENQDADASISYWYDCSKPTIQPHYIVTLSEPYLEKRPFRIEIPASNVKAYQEIEKRLLQGFQPETFGNIRGRIAPLQESEQHAWNFRLLPHSIVVGDYGIDTCDGSLEFTEENLDVFQGKNFCAFQAAQLITKIEKVWQIPSCE